MSAQSVADINNVLTSEERRTWAQSLRAGGTFAASAVKNVLRGGKRTFKPVDDPSLPSPIFNHGRYGSSASVSSPPSPPSPPSSPQNNGVSASTPLQPPSDSATKTSPVGMEISCEAPPSRDQNLAQLLIASEPEKALDVLIIGGGATGTGIALDLAARAVKAAEEKNKYKYVSKKDQQRCQRETDEARSPNTTFSPKENGLTTLSIGLVESNDYAAETSSRSSKLIHGGVRYLEKAVFGLDFQQLKLVFEALSERSNVVHQAPFLVHPIETIIPCYSFYDLAMFWTGMKMYDLLAVLGGGVVGGYSSFQPARSTSRLYSRLLPAKRKTVNDPQQQSIPTNESCSNSSASCAVLAVAKRIVVGTLSLLTAVFKWITAFPACLIGSVCYFDGQHHDSRVCLHVALTASRYGAACVNHCRLEGIETITHPTEGVLSKCTIVDRIAGRTHIVYAKSIVNATGPFSDSVRRILNTDHKNKVKPSHGTHITLPGRFAPRDRAMLIPSSDGRVIFCISYLGHCIAGTTDAVSDVEESPQAPEKDVEFILENLRAHLGPIERYDVLSVWCGIRPLAAPEAASDGTSSQSIVREHSIHVDVGKRVLSITGGKWTTYRKMAADAVDVLVEKGLLDGAKINHHTMAFSTEQKGSLITADLVLHGARKLQKILDDAAVVVVNNNKGNTNNNNKKHTISAAPSHFSKPYWAAANAISKRYEGQIPAIFVLNWLMTYGDAVETICEIALEVMARDGHYSTRSLRTGGESPSSSSLSVLSEEEAESYWRANRMLCCSVETPILATDVEVIYSSRYEHCERVQDFICRRSAIAFLNEGAARGCIERVASAMGLEKGWSAERVASEKADTHEYLKSFVAKA